MAAITVTALTTLDKVKDYLGITATTSDDVIARIISSTTRAIETYCARKFKARAYTLEQYTGDGTSILLVDNYPIISIERIAVGTTSAFQVTCSSSGALSATASITRTELDPPTNTQIKLSIHGGTNDGDNTAAFATYATLTALATQVTTLTGWTASAVGSFGTWASTELIPHGSRECLDTPLFFEVPDQRQDDYELDHENGTIYSAGGLGVGFKNIYIDYVGGYTTIPADLEMIAIEIIADMYNTRKADKSLKKEKIGDYMYERGDSDIVSSVKAKSADLSPWRRHTFR